MNLLNFWSGSYFIQHVEQIFIRLQNNINVVHDTQQAHCDPFRSILHCSHFLCSIIGIYWVYIACISWYLWIHDITSINLPINLLLFQRKNRMSMLILFELSDLSEIQSRKVGAKWTPGRRQLKIWDSCWKHFIGENSLNSSRYQLLVLLDVSKLQRTIRGEPQNASIFSLYQSVILYLAWPKIIINLLLLVASYYLLLAYVVYQEGHHCIDYVGFSVVFRVEILAKIKARKPTCIVDGNLPFLELSSKCEEVF